MTESFTETFAARLAGYGARPCVQFDDRWFTGTEVAAYVHRLEEKLCEAGVPDKAPIGVVVRNRYPHAAAILGALAVGRPVVMIYSFQSAEAISRDVETVDLAAVLADPDDWTTTPPAGCAGIGLAGEPTVLSACTVRPRPAYDGALHILTSGTTGPPKRFAVQPDVLEHAVFSVTGGQASPEDPPELVYWPLGGIGGVCQLVAGVYTGKRLVLLEKFTVEAWVSVVRTHALRRAGVQPAVLRMLLDADLDPAALSSLEFIVCASGPLEPDSRDEFEKRYGIPVLTAYGATEFAGSVCAWTPELYREFGATKRASAGRPLPGVEVRITDGLLEARIARLGPDWIRTSDLAAIDADGFITLLGRADGAINRGGFKILPETVRQALLLHPAVRDAAVIGIPDARLGEVPVAVVEVYREVTADLLKQAVRQQLPAHHVPVAIRVVGELPRTPALKVSIPAVRQLFAT